MAFAFAPPAFAPPAQAARGFGFPAMPQPQPAADIPVVSPPTDNVQCLGWSPAGNHLVSGSWDGVVRQFPASRPMSLLRCPPPPLVVMLALKEHFTRGIDVSPGILISLSQARISSTHSASFIFTPLLLHQLTPISCRLLPDSLLGNCRHRPQPSTGGAEA